MRRLDWPERITLAYLLGTAVGHLLGHLNHRAHR